VKWLCLITAPVKLAEAQVPVRWIVCSGFSAGLPAGTGVHGAGWAVEAPWLADQSGVRFFVFLWDDRIFPGQAARTAHAFQVIMSS
jgi:hypothetical protein